MPEWSKGPHSRCGEFARVSSNLTERKFFLFGFFCVIFFLFIYSIFLNIEIEPDKAKILCKDQTMGLVLLTGLQIMNPQCSDIKTYPLGMHTFKYFL